MPHIIIDCSDNLFTGDGQQEVMQLVFETAKKSELFRTEDIKVRIRPYTEYLPAGPDNAFVHVFAYIMEGRTVAQKHALSESVVSRLKAYLPDVPVISMNVMDFEKATYNNRNTV